MVHGGFGRSGMEVSSFDQIFLKPDHSCFFPEPGRPSTSQGFRPSTPGGSVPNLHAGLRPTTPGGSYRQDPTLLPSGFGERPPSRGGFGQERPPSRGGGGFGGERPPSRGGNGRPMPMGARLPPAGPRMDGLGGGGEFGPEVGGGKRDDGTTRGGSGNPKSLARPKSAVDLQRAAEEAGIVPVFNPITHGLGIPVPGFFPGDSGLEKLPPRPKSSDGCARRPRGPAVREPGEIFSAPFEDPREVFRGGMPPTPTPGEEALNRRPKSSPAGALRPRGPGARAAAVRRDDRMEIEPRGFREQLAPLSPPDPAGGEVTHFPPPPPPPPGPAKGPAPAPWTAKRFEHFEDFKRQTPAPQGLGGGGADRGGAKPAPYPVAAGEDPTIHPREFGALQMGPEQEVPQIPPAAFAAAFDGTEIGVADLLRDPNNSPSRRGGLPRSSSVPQTREERFAEKEKWRLVANIPTQEDYPHCCCVGWDAKRPLQPPIYTLNPLTHTVDKFQQNRKKRNDMEKTRTNRYTRPSEASIKDAMKFNRLKGVAEYQEILKLGDNRNRAYNRQVNKNERVFRRSSGAGTCFVDLMIRQGERLSRFAGSRIRT